jgi:antitoxin (DNA-binding transcriptional repressor) of toxin-antitoxin stability system
MTVVTLEEAQAKLPELIQSLPPGSRIELTIHGVTVATITREAVAPSLPSALAEQEPRVAGTAKDRILWMADDFNDSFEDFDEDAE